MKKYHFIGIKGSGMSSLAQILHDLGHYVQGSDIEERIFTQKPLEERNIPMMPFRRENIQEGFTIIAGNAFKEEHMEINCCIQKNIPYIRYHEFLKTFMKNYRSIAVSGAHGKTSTTGLLSHVLGTATKTTFLIGDGTGKGQENSTHFVFEACEYRRHFLAYCPNYSIITNIDFDHPDYFSGIEDVKEAFLSFSNQTKNKVIACGDDHVVRQTNFEKEVLYYGFSDENDIIAKNIEVRTEGTSFDVYYKNNFVDTFTIPMYGNHQVLNALSVIGVCVLEEIELNIVKEAFKTYTGVKRRFTETHQGTNIVIDDYAHHPTEIKATLESAKKKYPERKIVAIFQPHTFTRTKTFMKEFADSFEGSDVVYLADIFGSAREERGELTIHDLIQRTKNAHYINEDEIEVLNQYEHSVLLFMGAGDIGKIQSAYENKKTSV